MATLKSIKNKYLTTTDQTVLGVDTNKDNISLIAFKLAAADSIVKFNMVDGFIDAFQDTSGVDAGNSTNEIRDSTGEYYSSVSTPTVTGGNAITVDGDYTVHKFTTDGNYITDTAQTVEYLVIGGGGGGAGAPTGGGGHGMGAGGAGEFAEGTDLSLSATTYAVQVGDAGTGGVQTHGGKGQDSILSSITAEGGGAGKATTPGGNGGSGGGGGNGPESGSAVGGTAQASGSGRYGFNGGGVTGDQNNTYLGGGGGGAGAVGAAGVSTPGPYYNGGNGGAGRASDILIASTNVTYAGGGGASTQTQYPGEHGSGGSGGGGAGTHGSTGNPGATNTGSGGGGAGNHNGSGHTGGAGGSGLVVIRRPTTNLLGNLTLVSNTQTAAAQPTVADVVLTYTNGAGTATINTDLKAHASRDNGTTYTEGTLVLESTMSGDTVLSARGIDISGQPAGTSMRYKITTHNQSASKTTRIMATSLAWAT